nr:unnamed protein product [Callosobruchus chinensis]
MISIETKDVFTRYSTDVIASTVYGVEVDSLQQPNNPFYMMGKQATILDGWSTVTDFMKIVTPKLRAILNIKLLPGDVTTFFTDLVEEIIKTREEQKVVRSDMIQFFMQARKGHVQNGDGISAHVCNCIYIAENAVKSITNLNTAAQAMMFFFGGCETSAGLINFLFYELAANQEIQIRLRKDIQATLKQCDGNLTYEALVKMEYMDMVVSETLRKWPVNPVTDRICTKPYMIAPVQPGEKPLHLEKGTHVSFPTYSIQRDPQYFPEPKKFDPERFSSRNVKNIHPFTYMPFGVGPRSCIGRTFALLETKIVVFYILNSFEVIFTEKSRVPITISENRFTLSIEGNNWLGLRSLKRQLK